MVLDNCLFVVIFPYPRPGYNQQFNEEKNLIKLSKIHNSHNELDLNSITKPQKKYKAEYSEAD